jgi:hypothetical protein
LEDQAMMGRQEVQEALFYRFRIEDQSVASKNLRCTMPTVTVWRRTSHEGRIVTWSWFSRQKEDLLISPKEAEILFRRIAKNFNLEVLKQEEDSVELSMLLPVQPGLKSEIWLCLQNIDELWFVVEDITCSMFPFKEVKDDFEQALSGLLSGEYRLVLWNKYGDELPFKGEIQRPRDNGWETVYSYRRMRSRLFFLRGEERKRELFIGKEAKAVDFHPELSRFFHREVSHL